MSSESLSEDLHYMRLALLEAEKCEPTPSAFCVGCIIVATRDNSPIAILASGYSRELPGNTHAEANALAKARVLQSAELSSMLGGNDTYSIDDVLRVSDVYTTMEPCSIRTSGLAPCADALISAQVRRCVIGVGEPDDFVVCEGARKLTEAGIEVIWLKGLEDECLRAARRGHQLND